MISQKGRFSSGNNSGDVTRPQLTSLIDVMTILLVFLLQNFSVEGNLITPPTDIELAQSQITIQPKENFTLQVTTKMLKINGKDIAPLPSFTPEDSLLISELYTALTKVKKEFPDLKSKNEIRIEADKSTPFSILKRVMYTCNQAGLTEFSVLVLRKQTQ